MRQLALLLVLASLSMPAFAVYKCDIDGKTVYRDAPCPGGKEVDVSPAASGKDGNDAQKRLMQEKKQAKQLERERHKREAAQDRDEKQAARRAAARKKKCASLERRKRWADEDTVRYSGKAAESARIKARRIAEQYAQECS